jgi:hypothetical protein
VKKVATTAEIDLDIPSQHFFELTGGSVSARIRDFIADAQAAAEGGDQRAALTALALACEFHLDTLLAALLWEENLAPPDAARIRENTNITSRVAQHFSSRLKGNWTRNPGKPIGEWFHEVVVVRNSVLHGGRTPMRSEVDIAGEATNRLYAFLAERLVSNWRRYPKTMSVFVGPKAVALYAPKNRREEVETQLLAHNKFRDGPPSMARRLANGAITGSLDPSSDQRQVSVSPVRLSRRGLAETLKSSRDPRILN